MPATGDSVVIANGNSVTVAAAPPNAVSSVTISGTSSNTTLTVNGGFTLSVTGDVTINAPTSINVTNLVTLNTGGAALAIGGNLNIAGGSSSSRVARLTIGNSSSDHVDVAGSVNFSGTAAATQLTFSGAGSLNVAGDFSSGGTFTAGSGTVTFNGTSTQNVGPYTYNALVIANSGATATTAGNITAASVTINGGAVFSVPSTNTLAVTGNFSNNGTYTGGGAVSLKGNFSNNGTFTSGGGTWTFNGTSTQTITGTTTFTGVAINNAAGITLASNVTVGTTVTFTNGDVATGSNLLLLPCAATTTAGANSYVNGNVRLTFPAGVATCVFPVGDLNTYAPITVATTAGSNGGTLTGSTTAGQSPQFWNSDIDATQDVNRYWTLGLTSGDTLTSFPSGASYNVTLGFAASDITGGTVTNFKVALFANGWSAPAGSASGTSATLTGQTSFGRYVVGTPLSVCNPPANIPSGVNVSCVCDNFTRTTLNPSTIYGGNWLVSAGSGSFVPTIVNSGRFRLTQNVNNQATAATVPGIFPAAGNYISVEFKHYAYNSTSSGSVGGGPTTGADGMTVTLSDYSVPASPGAYGGSLGYAQKTGINGFAGGWVGIALDEWGNYQNATEGRVGGNGGLNAAPNLYESVGARGSGSGTSGYQWFAGTGSKPGGLNIDAYNQSTPGPGYYYQVIVDARSYTASNKVAGFSVNRDTTGTGSSYTSLITVPNIYTAATAQGFTQANVPTNWQISFASGTGSDNNIHEIAAMRICAQTVFAQTAGSSASPFYAIDDAYLYPLIPGTNPAQRYTTPQTYNYPTAAQGNVYTKLAGTPFQLSIAAASGVQINTPYSGTVTVQLIDDSIGPTSCNLSASACASCSKPVLASQQVTFTGNGAGQTNGEVLSNSFTLNSAYSRVIARMCEGTSCPGSNSACSTHAFTVRPTALTVSSSATNAALAGSPAFKAGTDGFTLTATTTTSNYTGTPQVNAGGAVAGSGVRGWNVGTFVAQPATSPSSTLFPVAGSFLGNLSSTGTFTYSEAGNFTLLGYAPSDSMTNNSANDLIIRGIDDETWVGTPNPSTTTGANGLLLSGDMSDGDCIVGSYSNAKNTSNNDSLFGRYGCYFGLTATFGPFGRFIPDHYNLMSGATITPAVRGSGGSTPFTYMDSPKLGIAYTLQACAGVGSSDAPCSTVTGNYDTDLLGNTATPSVVAEDMAAANQGNDLSSRVTLGTTTPAQLKWGQGQYAVSAPGATFSLPMPQPGGAAGGPFDMLAIGVKIIDADGGTIYNNDMNASTTGTCTGSGCNAKQIGTTSVRQGRLALAAAYGSELLNLPVTVSAQYYRYSAAAGTGNWVTNTDDSSNPNTPGDPGIGVTTIPVGAAVLSSPTPRNGSTAPIVCFLGVTPPCNATSGQLSPTSVTLYKGVGTFMLYDSNSQQGTIDIAINLGAAGTDTSCNPAHKTTTGGAATTWLRYGWCSGGVYDPSARLKFGSSKAPYIYLREMY